MDNEELLAQLADIHLPLEVSFWPPAPGWWVLACLLLAALVFLVRKLKQAQNQKKICQQALAELDLCYANMANDQDEDVDATRLRFVNDVNSVIRRVALYHFPQAKVASLAGAAWVDFIREKGNSSLLSDEIAQALSFGRFQTKCEVDVDALNGLGQQWIKSLYLVQQAPSTDAQGISS